MRFADNGRRDWQSSKIDQRRPNQNGTFRSSANDPNDRRVAIPYQHITNRNAMMKRCSVISLARLLVRRWAIMAACTGLAIAIGCQREAPQARKAGVVRGSRRSPKRKWPKRKASRSRAAKCSTAWPPPTTRRRAMPTPARCSCWPRRATRRSTKTPNFSRHAGAPEQGAVAGLRGHVGLRRQEDVRRDRGLARPGAGQAGARGLTLKSHRRRPDPGRVVTRRLRRRACRSCCFCWPTIPR